MNDLRVTDLLIDEFYDEIEQMKISLQETGRIQFNYDSDGNFCTVASWN